MIGTRPAFMDSPYFVGEPGNWHLKPGAPAEVVEEFKLFMGETNEAPQITVDEMIKDLEKS